MCQAHATRRDCCLGQTESQSEDRSDSLPASTNRKRAGPSRPATSRELSGTHPAIRLNKGSFELLATRSRSNRSRKHSTACQHSTGFTSALIGALLANCPVPTTSGSLKRCARHCHRVARVQQWEVVCNDADDDDDPPYPTGADIVCGVKITGETGTVVCSVNLTFSMLGSASDTERDILSCASLTRALRSASEDMAWMIRVLHRSV